MTAPLVRHIWTGHQPRERAVPCGRGCGRETWALSGICEACNPPPVEPECEVCGGDRVIEVPTYGRMAAEATRVTRCPRCSDGKPVRATS